MLGVLFNVCIDAFSAQNGATMFALGTAAKGTAPPAEWGALSMVNDIPEGGHQLAGPAGTAILYGELMTIDCSRWAASSRRRCRCAADCRTWHRQHANLSPDPRSCLLFIFTPRWVLPAHGDQTAMFESMHAAPLTQRERDRVRHLLGDRNAAQSEWPTVHATLPEDQSKL
eukprot:COSAG04_NODE_4660_length_1961_cov_1.544039_1_plen_171_part_00